MLMGKEPDWLTDLINTLSEHAPEHQKKEISDYFRGKIESFEPDDEPIKLDLNDSNSCYLGDGVYAHTDNHNRLWVVTYNGISITNQICLEPDVFSALVRYYERMTGNKDIVNE